MNKKLPQSVIKQRFFNEDIYNEAIKAGVTELQAKIIANRKLPKGTNMSSFISPRISDIPNLKLLKDLEKAGERIADAIINEEVIALVCDFDVDGISSAAVMYKAITDLFGYSSLNTKVIISNRMKENYGFSTKVLDRILNLDPIPTLLITADQGSSDARQVDRYLSYMNENGLKGDVIISDHHEIPENGGPKNAYAFVNPQRKDDEFPDKTICGCTVALFLMTSTRAKLIEKGYLKKDSEGMKNLIAYSTAATISDCVSMASGVNRAIVKQGLKEINEGRLAAWRSMRTFLNNDIEPIKADSIGFGLGPRINACSRTGGDGLNAVRFYLSDTDEEAIRYLDYLNVDNTIRKDIEKRLVEEATLTALNLVDKGYLSLVIFNKNGHHGIHGIAASRICERFGRPVIMLSPKETEKTLITKEEAEVLIGKKIIGTPLKYYDIGGADFITCVLGKTKKENHKFYKETITTVSGSARSIDGLGNDGKGYLSILECLIEVEENNNIFLGFGGHTMAAGMSLEAKNIRTLRNELEKSVRKRVEPKEIYPKVWTDGYLDKSTIINLDLVDEINALEPYGRQFDYPSFTIEATIAEYNLKGENKDTGILTINYNGFSYKAIWFKMNLHSMFEYIKEGYSYKFVVEIRDNYFKGNRSCQLNILHAELN